MYEGHIADSEHDFEITKAKRFKQTSFTINQQKLEQSQNRHESISHRCYSGGAG